MKFSFENSNNTERVNEVETYSCQLESGVSVEIEYKVFESMESEPDEVVILLAGLQMSPEDNTLKTLSESFADSSGMDTYTIQSYLKQAGSEDIDEETDLFYEEAQGIAQLIKDKQFKKVTIAGYSIGGVKGIDLAHILQNDSEVEVEGLVLLSSPGLYQQEPNTLKSNLIKDSLFTPHKVAEKHTQYPKAFKRGLHGAQSLLKVIMKGSKVKREFSEMEEFNPYVGELDMPVIIMQGSEDQVVEADKIVPSEIEPSEREAFLKENLFKNSPYVKMVVADKLGKHGLPVLRAESVASASIGLLDRSKRVDIAE